MNYSKQINKEDREFYSVNFLLAEFEQIDNLKRDLKIIDNQVQSSLFQTNNFKTRAYYKQISTCLKTFYDNDSNK